jgi:hypothetical protein
VLRVRTNFTGPQGSPWVSTIYGDGISQVEAEAQVLSIGTFWGAVDALMNNDVDWATEAEVERVNVATGDVEAVFVTTPQTGTGALVTELLPLVAQAVVRWRTGVFVGGREIRGRTFIPGLTEAANTGGSVTPANAATIQAAAQAMIDDVTWEMVVWSRTHAQAPEVATASVWSQFSYLGSRRD